MLFFGFSSIVHYMENNTMRHCKNERGQAITEMTIGLLGLSFVMIGVLLIALLGLENIRCTSRARTLADKNSVTGSSGDITAENLADWQWNDNLFLYKNGTKVTSSQLEGINFSMLDELSTQGYDLRKDASKFTNNPFPNLAESSLFLDAADLTSGVDSKEDVLRNNHFMMGPDETSWNSDAVSLFLNGQKDFTLTGKIWMPKNSLE